MKEKWGIDDVRSSGNSGIGVLGEGVGVGTWKDLGKEVGREDWWRMDMGNNVVWGRYRG
jgi:hypothetical protein